MTNNSKEKLIKEINTLRKRRKVEPLPLEQLEKFDEKRLGNILNGEKKFLTFSKKPPFDKRILLFILFPLILIAIFYIFLMPQKASKPIDYTNIIKQCVPKSYATYLVCCQNGNLSLCTDQKIFHPNQFLIVRANMRYLLTAYNITWKSYYECGYTELNSTGIEYSQEFFSHTAFIERNDSLTIGCSQKLYLEESHVLRLFGFVPNKNIFKLMEVRIFPDHDYKKLGDFNNYLNESKVLLSEERNVE
jgi:hypothetical protein